MVRSDLVLKLIHIHFDSNRSGATRDKDFSVVVRSIAAGESQAGHPVLAKRMLEALDAGLAKQQAGITAVPPHYSELVESVAAMRTKADWVVCPAIEKGLERVCKEWANRERLAEKGVLPSHKLLFYGEPGTGKTMTCSVLANCLGLPLFRVREGVIEGVLGKSQTNLMKVFDMINSMAGVYLFDEFDSIGMGRSTKQQEHSELRRTLNAFLQFLERTNGDSVVVCATNMAESLDKALFRRFDQLWHFPLPGLQERHRLIRLLTGCELDDTLAELTEGFSQSEVTRLVQQGVRESLIEGRTLDNDLLVEMLDLLNKPMNGIH